MRWLATLLTVVCLGAAPRLGAAEQEEESPRQVFLRGVELFGEEQYEAALDLFEGSYAVNPVNLVLYNIAMCQRALFRYVESIDSFQRYLAIGGGEVPADRREEVEGLIEEMRVQIGTLQLTVEPDHASVLVDGQPVATEHLGRLRLRSGLHEVLARAPGFQEEALRVRVEPQRVNEVRLILSPVADGDDPEGPGDGVVVVPVEPEQPLEEPPPDERRGVHRQWWFWTVIGVVVVGGALGLGLGLGLDRDDPLDGADLDWRVP